MLSILPLLLFLASSLGFAAFFFSLAAAIPLDLSAISRQGHAFSQNESIYR